MTRTDVATLIAAWLDAWRRKDPAAVAQLYAPNAVLQGPMAGTQVGRDAIESFFASMLRALPDLVYSDERLVIEENHVALFLTASGTHEGAFLGYPASGHSVVVECAALFTVSEAGIERELRCFDFTGLLVQLGVLKAKPA